MVLQLLPAVDVADGQAVRLVQGEAGTETGYGDPLEAALAWQDQGAQWIFLLWCVIFAGDTGAYYVGKNFGQRKLCPSVSPGKTVEGALGGIAAHIVVGSLAKLILLPELGWAMSLLFFVCAGIAGQTGDLFESILKRSAGIKDSSNILPGHGGILDRIDALIMAGPVAYFFKMVLF